MGIGALFQAKAAATPEEKLRSFSEKYESSGRIKKFLLRKSNPVFYRIHSSGRAIVPASKAEKISGSDLCATIEGVLGPLSDRRGFNRESEIDKCIFELNRVQFEKLLAGARDIVRSQHSMNGRTPYEIDLVSENGQKQMVVRFARLLSEGTKARLSELFTFSELAHFRFCIVRCGHGEILMASFPVLKGGCD